jgi:hypothetical protein
MFPSDMVGPLPNNACASMVRLFHVTTARTLLGGGDVEQAQVRR